MARVITYSQKFPAYHPKAGKPTQFVEGFWKSLIQQKMVSGLYTSHIADVREQLGNYDLPNYDSIIAKNHTIRAGNRWKVGDMFSPRIWSGKPYNSKQIIIAPDIEIKKVWDIQIERADIDEVPRLRICISGKVWCYIGVTLTVNVVKLCNNDGLSVADFADWFQIKKGEYFKGQIVCWNDSIDYQL